MDDNLEKIKKIIAKQLEIDHKIIKQNLYIIEDLGADSIDLVEIIMAFELEFKIEIPFADEEKLNKIDDINSYIKSKMND